MLDIQSRHRTTFVFSTHDQSVMRYADDVHLLMDGRLAEGADDWAADARRQAC